MLRTRIAHIRHFAVLLLAAMLFSLATPQLAQAEVTCDNFSFDSINFGEFSPLVGAPTANGSLRFRCYNDAYFFQSDYKVALCFHIRTGTTGGSNWNPRVATMANTSTLQFQINQSPGSTPWGDSSGPGLPPAQSGVITLPNRPFLGGIIYVQGVVNYTATILPNQTLTEAGTYSNNFTGSNTEIIAVSTRTGTPSCLGQSSSGVTLSATTFPFTVNATVIKYCSVNASTMDFGAVDALQAGPIESVSKVTTRCTKGTSYQMALEPSGSPVPTNGTGILRSASTVVGNPDTYVTYSLYRDAGRTQTWGNQFGSNTNNQVGSGMEQEWPVYGRITSVNVIPNSYTDTVTVKVTY